jgi:hypothetical protein
MALVTALSLWIIVDRLTVFPNFVSYYDEIAGGTANGYRVAVDSNYDWGQDLKRLKKYTEENRIDRMYIDYFGGGNTAYYFGERGIPWQSAKGAPPAGAWFAISSSFRQTWSGTPVRGFMRNREDAYEWLRGHTPVAQVGYSIFVYKLP